MLQGWIQIAITLVIVLAITPFLGGYMSNVYLGRKTWLDPVLLPLEQTIYRLSGVQAKENMIGWQYAGAGFYSNAVMLLLIANSAYRNLLHYQYEPAVILWWNNLEIRRTDVRVRFSLSLS
jgi:K+-transporting ATPase A subunit